MAVTFAVTGLKRDVTGSKRIHFGVITATGTTSDNGDAVTPALFGLSSIERLDFDPFLDSEANPENAATAKYIPSTGKVVFVGGAAAGSPQAALTDGATVTGYAANFIAVGR
jgi:hypothetical protein